MKGHISKVSCKHEFKIAGSSYTNNHAIIQILQGFIQHLAGFPEALKLPRWKTETQVYLMKLPFSDAFSLLFLSVMVYSWQASLPTPPNARITEQSLFFFMKNPFQVLVTEHIEVVVISDCWLLFNGRKGTLFSKGKALKMT